MAYLSAFDRIRQLPGFEEESARADVSFEANHDLVTGWFRAVGVEPDLAEAAWALNGEPSAWPVYPDAVEVVRAIKERDVRTALVSNFHVDLRPHLISSGIELDAFVISFEQGCQKPDAKMFLAALDALDVERSQALMVGDSLGLDGGAAAIGIDTLLLPAPTGAAPRRLDVILGMLG
jgi:HAD superfamily hydrolase (TIGR01549 family)